MNVRCVGLVVRCFFKNILWGDCMLFGDWLREWLDVFVRPRVKESTYRSYLQDAAHLSMLYQTELEDLSVLVLQNAVNRLSGYSASVIRRSCGLLRRSLDKAVAVGQLPAHCMRAVEAPRGKPAQQIQALSDFEIMQLYSAPMSERGFYYPLFMWLLHSGMRVGEALALDHSDIDRDVIHIRRRVYRGEFVLQPKTAAGVRDLPITAELRTLLRGCGTTDGLVWRNSRGEAVDYRRLLASWHSLQNRIGYVRSYGLHVFRHTFASTLYRRGADIKTLSVLLGHSRVGVTYDIYCHVTHEQAAETMKLLRYHADLSLTF